MLACTAKHEGLNAVPQLRNACAVCGKAAWAHSMREDSDEDAGNRLPLACADEADGRLGGGDSGQRTASLGVAIHLGDYHLPHLQSIESALFSPTSFYNTLP
jgi:hypothetical protein